MMVKIGLELFILKFTEPLQRSLLSTLPSQFSPSGQIVLHWAAAILKGLGEFQNKKILDILETRNPASRASKRARLAIRPRVLLIQ